jgi:hypothetical protein
VDPYAGDPQAPVSLHRYLYAGNDPVCNLDPSGNFFLEAMAAMTISNIFSGLAIPTIGCSNVANIPQTRLGFDKLWDAYPVGTDVDEAYALIGGRVLYNHISKPDDYQNACALRMSRALNYGGHPIPFSSGKTGSGEDKKWYFYRVDDVEQYITGIFGPPDVSGVTKNMVTGKKGILLFRNCGWQNATGHITLWYMYMAGDSDDWAECSKASFWGFK